ncbi:MAG: hypothetical protein AAGG02_12725 [Cyanobacteria bacterium P01_H01_bin.15]
MTAATPAESPASVQVREIQEVAIAITAKSLNPAMLNQDFLKLSAIVPQDWEFKKPPVANQSVAQLSFKNGVNITAQPRTVTFSQAVNEKAEKVELLTPEVARRFVEKLPNAEYQALNISPRALVPLSGGPESARDYIAGTLLAQGPWQDFGKVPVQANLNLLYQLDDAQLNLSINQAKLQLPDGTAIPALLFAGNFVYNLAQAETADKINYLSGLIGNWQKDLNQFREVVEERFLQAAPVRPEEESLFPAS